MVFLVTGDCRQSGLGGGKRIAWATHPQENGSRDEDPAETGDITRERGRRPISRVSACLARFVVRHPVKGLSG